MKFAEKELAYLKANHKNWKDKTGEASSLLLLFCMKYSKLIVAYTAVQM